MTRDPTPEQIQYLQEKNQRELTKRRNQASHKISLPGMVILMIILALVYIVDEITSNAKSAMDPEVVQYFWVDGMGIDYNTGLSNMSLITMVPGIIITFLIPFYKSLADRLGRKPFLILNVLGMGVGMFTCMVAPNVYVYLAGTLIISFFIPNDIQVMYIMEFAPEKHRAKLCSIAKACGYLGVTSIPLFRRVFMGNDPTRWRYVFLVPVILAIIVAVICLAVRETPVFLNQRIKHLETPIEEILAEKKNRRHKDETESKGGVLNALRFIVKHRQIRWICISALVFAMSIAITGFYTSIMATNGMDSEAITKALFVFPIMNGLMTLLGGYLTDRLGRKGSILIQTIVAFITMVAFVLSSSHGVNPYLVGGLYGIFVGAFWSVSDLLYLILPGESTPTNLRASVLGTMSLLLFIGVKISVFVVSIFMRFIPNLGGLVLAVCMPFLLAALIIVMTAVRETKGIDINTVQGDEWDKKKS